MIGGDGNGDERDLAEETLDEYDRLLDEAEEEGTVPEDDEEVNDWMIEQLETAGDNVLNSEEEMEASEGDGDHEAEEESDEIDEGWGEPVFEDEEDGFDPNEENWEAEDMPGDNADEREEAYDNHDWDAADG